LNRSQRAAATRKQLQQAEAAGNPLHDCPHCSEAVLWSALIARIEQYGRQMMDPATDHVGAAELKRLCAPLIDAVKLLEMPALPGVH